MKHEIAQGQRLFLSADFESFQVGLASEENVWIVKNERSGYIADQLASALETIVAQCCFDSLMIHLINGPGSTLGIRTLCAFVRTLLALEKVKLDQVFTCNYLYFAQACLALRKDKVLPYICARVNFSKTLCLSPENDLHTASEEEMQNAVWLPHPCLKDKNIFSFSLGEILPILNRNHPWQSNDCPDVVAC